MEQINVGNNVVFSKEFLDLKRGKTPMSNQRSMSVVKIKGTTAYCVTKGKKTPQPYHISFLKIKNT